MSPFPAVLAAFVLSAPAPILNLQAADNGVALLIGNPRSTPLQVADPKDVDGLGYSLVFIRVRGPDKALVWDEREGGWWSPLYQQSRFPVERPEPWTIPANGALAIKIELEPMTRGLEGPQAGECSYQARAVIRDHESWPWTTGGTYTVESNWHDMPCAELFGAR